VWLSDELVHFRMRGEMNDQVDVGVLDAVDPAWERCVVSREVLEQVAKLAGPRVLALVDTEDLVPVPLQPEREIRADLTRRSREQDLHASTTVRTKPAPAVTNACPLTGREG
jgi:hypothetical protein